MDINRHHWRETEDFPGGLVVRTLNVQCSACWLNMQSGNCEPHATGCGPKTNKKKVGETLRENCSQSLNVHAKVLPENAVLNVTEPCVKAAVSRGAVSRDGR